MKQIVTLGKTRYFWNKWGSKAAPFLGVFSLCAVTSSFRVSGVLASVGIAAAAAVSERYIAAAVLGAMLGYSLFDFYRDIPYLITLLSLLCWRGMVGKYPKLRDSDLQLCCSVFLFTLIPLCIKNAAEGGFVVDLIFCFAESLLTASLSYFLKNGFAALKDARRISLLGNIKKVSLSITAAIMLALLWQVVLPPFNFGRTVTVLLILLFSYRMEGRDAAFFGICISSAVVLCVGDHAQCLFVLCMGGVLAGFFSSFGRLLFSLIFFSVVSAGFLLTGDLNEVLFLFCDSLTGILFFLLLPEKKLSRLRFANTLMGKEQTYHRRMALKLRFTSQAIDDMKEAVEAISDKLYNSGGGSVQAVYDKTVESVCRRCGLKMFCWETAYSQSSEAFQKMTPILREKGYLEKGELPVFFKNHCAKPDELLQSVNAGYREYVSAQSAQRKVREAKMVAAEQFEGISGMLQNFSDELSSITSVETEKAAKALRFLREIGEPVLDLYCINDNFGRMRVEIYSKTPLKSDSGEIAGQFSELLERSFGGPTAVSAGELTKTVFFEEARYCVDFFCAQKTAAGNRISGDCCEYFSDTGGFFHAILSDGMGTGGRAAVDSIMTCSFASKLLKSGFGFDSALKLINSALLVKAGGESLATLDICCIDLYTGAARFLKAGGVSSFVRRKGEVTVVEGCSLPIGILQGVNFDRRELVLRNGDMVVMITDGAIVSSVESFKNEVAALKETSAKEAAARLLELCCDQNESPRDDITVAVGFLRETIP